MDRALRNLVDVIGLELDDAARRVSTFAADFLELPDRGRLVTGAWADVVQLDRDLRVQGVFLQGGAADVAHAR
jgi:N-acetylglucosamine-6-phosphate deacetylase